MDCLLQPLWDSEWCILVTNTWLLIPKLPLYYCTRMFLHNAGGFPHKALTYIYICFSNQCQSCHVGSYLFFVQIPCIPIKTTAIENLPSLLSVSSLFLQ